MPEAAYQALLWELSPDDPTHIFYAASNGVGLKSGHTRVGMKARARNDQQFKGTVIIGMTPCNCSLPLGEGGRPECVLEINWKHAHKRARRPDSEWFMGTPGVIAALRFRWNDDRAMAIVDELERNNRAVVA